MQTNFLFSRLVSTHRRNFPRATLIACGALLGGCAAQANLSGTVDATGQLSGRASGQAGIEANATAAATVRAPKAKPAPKKIAIRFEKGQLHIEHGEVNFELDSDKLKGDRTFESLGQLRDHLKAYPKVKVRIEGHTDSRGTDEYNADLSRRRANSVMKWLVEQGVEADRLTAKGFGERNPEVPEGPCKEGPPSADAEKCEAEVWSKNRRVEYPVLEGGDSLPVAVEETPVEEKPAPVAVVEPREPPTEPPPPEQVAAERCGIVGIYALGSPYAVASDTQNRGDRPSLALGGGLEVGYGCKIRLHGSIGFQRAAWQSDFSNGNNGVSVRFGVGLPLHATPHFVVEPRLEAFGADVYVAPSTAFALHAGLGLGLYYEFEKAYLGVTPGIEVGYLTPWALTISVPVLLSGGLRF